MKRISLICGMFLCALVISASNSVLEDELKTDSVVYLSVDTISIHSQSMKVDIQNVIILPDGYDSKKSKKTYPMLVLLHGYGGDYGTWINKTKPDLQKKATEYGLIIVCPDGKSSWYWDSPKDSTSRFDTYVSKELISYMDENYNTRPNAKSRAVAGFSMGGHGALWLAINHPDVFGACGSMSGGLDIRPFPKNWNMNNLLGAYNKNRQEWQNHTVIEQLHKVEPGQLSIIIDCGTEDFFYKVNERIHNEMLYQNITHTYITRPGGHNHTFWGQSLDYMLVFFDKHFKMAKKR